MNREMKLVPWEARTVKMSREAFVKEVKCGDKSESQLCRDYEISRVTGDKWLNRYENGEGLEDRNKVPFHVANKTPPEKEKKVLEVCGDHLAWRPRKIRQFLINKGEDPPSKSAIGNILNCCGCISEQHLILLNHLGLDTLAAPTILCHLKLYT